MGDTKSKSKSQRAAAGFSDVLAPVVAPIAQRVAGHMVQRLMGYWTIWHLCGGLEPLLASGLITRSTVYRNRQEFRQVFWCDVDEFLPEQAKGLHPRLVEE